MHSDPKDCTMKKLDIGTTNDDKASLLEAMSEDLGLLEAMSRGEFNTPPWDNCKKNEARYTLKSIISLAETMAKKNCIDLG